MSEKLHYKYNELIKSMVEYVGGALCTANLHTATHDRLGVWYYNAPSGIRYYCLCVYKLNNRYRIVRHRKAMPTDDTSRNLMQNIWVDVYAPDNIHPIFTIDVNPW